MLMQVHSAVKDLPFDGISNTCVLYIEFHDSCLEQAIVQDNFFNSDYIKVKLISSLPDSILSELSFFCFLLMKIITTRIPMVMWGAEADLDLHLISDLGTCQKCQRCQEGETFYNKESLLLTKARLEALFPKSLLSSDVASFYLCSSMTILRYFQFISQTFLNILTVIERNQL